MFRPLLLTLLATASLFSCTSPTAYAPGRLNAQAILPPGAITNPCHNLGGQAILPPGHNTPTRPKPCGCSEGVSANAILPPGHSPGSPGC